MILVTYYKCESCGHVFEEKKYIELCYKCGKEICSACGYIDELGIKIYENNDNVYCYKCISEEE